MLQQLRKTNEWKRNAGRKTCEIKSQERRKKVVDVPSPFNAKLIERIAEARINGLSFGAIAASLNQDGITGAHGGRWYASSVWSLFHRRKGVFPI